MFDTTQSAEQTRPRTCVARPDKKCWTAHNWAFAQCYSITGFLIGVKFRVFIGQLWCKIHWILQVRATNTIVYGLLFSYSERIQHRSTTAVWPCDWRGFKGANLPPDKINAKTEPYFADISVFTTFLVFRKLFFLRFLDCYSPVISGFRTVYRNPHPDTLSFLNVGEAPSAVASETLSSTSPNLAKSSIYALRNWSTARFSWVIFY